ncbi:hypothetical protein PMAC_001013 [Pneumocystis sp. 'macacae']|nr:hypothetical protein PMAC_001013 [Pneumocystis sp. 'macacae']
MTNISEEHNIHSNKNHKPHDFIEAKIAIRAIILGFIIGLSFLGSFHVKFWITALYNPLNVSISSFLFSNGYQYVLAHCFTVLEYLLEYIFFPQIKKCNNSQGFIIACIGQICRSLSMIHSAQNFSHKISLKKVKEHTLVTHEEEILLIHFFGEDYEKYRTRTPTLIPFIK